MNEHPIRAIFRNAMQNAAQQMWGGHNERYGTSPAWNNSSPVWNRPYDGGQKWNGTDQDYNHPARNSIGFNQGQDYGNPGMRQGHSFNEYEFSENMKKYWRGLADGHIEVPEDMAEAMCTMVAEAVKEHESRNKSGMSYDSHNEEEHERYKDAIERLREAPSNEKQRLMKELFDDDLTPDEQAVLRVMSEQKSYKRIAQEKGMTLDRYKEAKKGLKQKFKR